MVQEWHDDWLRIVFGSGPKRRATSGATGTVVNVRHSPAVLDPLGAPRGEQRVRITVVPSEAGLAWSLYLRDYSRESGEAPTTRVAWRLEPGTWQPLVGTKERVAVGRGRVRLDVDLRVDPDEVGPTPRLRFTAESA